MNYLEFDSVKYIKRSLNPFELNIVRILKEKPLACKEIANIIRTQGGKYSKTPKVLHEMQLTGVVALRHQPLGSNTGFWGLTKKYRMR